MSLFCHLNHQSVDIKEPCSTKLSPRSDFPQSLKALIEVQRLNVTLQKKLNRSSGYIIHFAELQYGLIHYGCLS